MPERSGSTIAIWVVAAVLAVLAGVRLLGGDEPGPAPVRIDGAGEVGGGAADAAAHDGGFRDGLSGGAAAGGADAGAGASGVGAGELYVHVAGAVRRPGLIRVPQGSRVAVALERAGGPTRRADLTLVNLAARLQDGQQIVVPVAGAPAPSASGAADGAGTGATARIHLSTATVEQLDEIDGIGPTLAERIIEYRDSHGGFRSLDELSQVDGIGEKRLATLRDALQP